MNMSTVIKMLEYCGMSYKNYQSEPENGTVIMIDDYETDVQCFIRISGSTMVIAFRGSDSCKDWKADFMIRKSCVPYNNYSSKIRVHSGFINTYKSKNVRGKIHKMINENIKKIYVTGHSYGAALAVLCAVDLEYNFPRKDYEVIVFGCPRVGNNAFKKSYNLRLFKTLRVEHRKDIVAKVPFAFMGYRHVGACLKIGGKAIPGFYAMKFHNLQKYYSDIWAV